MKADDIRTLNERCQKITGEQTRSREQQDVGLESLKISMITEIAAQLAESNEHLAKIANPLYTVENEASPWVYFLTENRRRVVFDKGEVVDVHEGVDPMDNSRLIVVISLRNQRYFRIIGDYGVVCAKLGIPMEGKHNGR